MAFDPDEFLKSSEPQPSAFDPDKFLQDTAPKPDPTVDRLETLHNTSSDTPENAARFKQLADSSGVTYEVAKAIPDKIEADSKRIDWKAFTSEAPKVAKHLAADPVAFDMAKDDIGSLKKIEQGRSLKDLSGDIGIRLAQGVSMAGQSVIGMADLAQKANPFTSVIDLAMQRETTTFSKMLADAGISFNDANAAAEGLVSDASKQASAEVSAGFNDGIVEGGKAILANPSYIAEKVAQSTPQMLVAMAAVRQQAAKILASSGPEALKAAMPQLARMSAAIEGAQSAGNYAGEKAESGDLTSKQQVAAVGQGLTTMAFGMLSNKFGKAIGIEDVETAAAAGLSQGGGFAGWMKRLTGTVVKEGPVEEGMQSTGEQMWQNFGDGNDLFQGVGQAFTEGSIIGAAQGGTISAFNDATGTIINTLDSKKLELDSAERNIASVNAELSAIGESKLLQTSPKTLHQLMDVMDGEEKQDLYIDPTELFQGGVSKDAFLQAVPGAAQEIADAEVNGGVIKVSRNELLVGIKAANNPEMEAEVVRHIKVDAKGRSMAELEAEQGNLSNELQDLADKAVSQFAEESKGNQDLQDLLATIKDDLKAAGTPEGNEWRAMLWASLANAQGKASGQSAMDVYKQQFRGKVANESLGGDVLNQQNPFTPENGFETVEEIDFSLPEGFTSLDDGSNVKPSASENGGADGKQPELDEFGDRRTNPDDKDIQLSNFPKARGWRVYDKAQLLEGIRLASDKIRGELGRTGSSESQATRELTSGPLGPFTSSSVSSEIKGDRLFIYYVGQEQAELGLTDEAALTVILNKTGELVVNGPPADSATFEEFKKLGWADFAEMKGGEKSDYWTSLTGFEGLDGAKGLLNPGTAAMLADAHARLRAWRGEDKVLINWVRYTGATGNALKGRKGVAFFQSQNQTETPAFKKWFGDSKVVDADGKPLVVYHGTSSSTVKVFSVSKSEGGYTYFSVSPWVASEYAARAKGKRFAESADWIESGGKEKADKPNVIPVYLSIQNPFVIDFGGKVKDTAFDEYIFEQAQKKGHDGVVIKNIKDMPSSFWEVWGDGIADDMPSDDIYIPFTKTQIKSSIGNNGAFDPNDPSILYQDGSKPWYKSALLEAATNLKQEKGTPEQMMAILSKTPGVKPAELEATGLPEYLQMQGKSVTKQQIIDYLAGNGVQVQETMLGADGEPKLPDGWTVKYEREQDAWVVYDEDGDEVADGTSRADAIEMAMDDDVRADNADLAGDTKFGQYVLPGGKNYRELLLTLPEKTSADDARADYERWAKSAGLSPNASLSEAKYLTETGKTAPAPRTMTAMNADAAKNFKSSHYGQANILAHVRFNERTDADGKRVLFLEELQSDWAQKGRKEGFNTSPAEKARHDELRKKWLDGKLTEAETTEFDRLSESGQYKNNGVPSAPFVTSTDAWIGLSMKRMIAYAAQNGFDRIAWTTGEQQADRYDLSKQVDSVKVFHDANGTYEVRAIKDGEIISSQTNMEESKLESVVGKDLAQKIINEEGEQDKKTGFYTYKGDDLKVGGEGMKSFYDNIVPKVAKEITKKMGGKLTAVQIVGAYNEDIRISSFPDGTAMVEGQGQDKEFDTVAEAEAYRNELMGAQQQPGFDITPEMRSAVESGLPLFQNNEKAKGAFNPQTRDIALFAQADLSTFLHETGHLFLEIQMEMAAAENASERMVKDADNVLKWFGIKGETAEDRRAAWSAMSVDQQRQYHEKYAESFEQYLFEGKAPSIELRDSFRTFRQWLTHVYKSISKFLLGHDGAKLNDEVRGIFDRMLATEEQIRAAEESSGLYQFFTEKPEGLSQGEWDNYLRAVDEATQSAVDQLQSRSIRDLKWATGAQNKALKALQRQAKSERRIARMDARKAVLSRPEYRAWQFLTAPVEGVEASNKKAKASAEVEPHRDSLFTAIAKLGGLNKDQAVSQYGIDPKDFHNRKGSIVGKPVLRATGGLSPDAMAEALSQFGYMKLDDNGKWDILDLDDMLRNEAAGDLVYSQNADYDLLLGKPVIAPNAEDVDFMGGRLSRQAIREMYDDADLAEMQGEQVDTAGKLMQFAGVNARTAMMDKWIDAKEMVAKGIHAEKIRRDTGWFMGVDGKWRFEISDDEARMIDPPIYEAWENYFDKKEKEKYGPSAKPSEFPRKKWLEYLEFMGDAQSEYDNRNSRRSLEYLLDHPKLYEAYPDLKNLLVSFVSDSDYGGMYSSKWDEITLKITNSEEDMLSVLLHEIQHAIQQREDFAKGGNHDASFTSAVKDAIGSLANKSKQDRDQWAWANKYKIDDSADASRVARFGLMYESAQRLIDYSKRDKPSGVLRLIRNEMQWVYNHDLYKDNDKARELYRAWYDLPKPHKMAKRNAFLSNISFDAGQFLLEQIPEDLVKQFKSDTRTMKGMLKSLERTADRKQADLQPLRDLEKKQDVAETLNHKHIFSTPYQIYRALAGEVEARNTQARQKMTADERIDQSPASTQDVRAENIIVMFGGMDIQAPISMMQSDSSGLLFQPAYHGTPYKFDKFSLEHMGKGEGAQAYGWGLYFAGNKDVAEYYRQALTQTYGLLDSSGNPVKMVTQDESAALAFVQANGHDFDKGIADLKEVAKTKPHFAAAVPIVERWKADGFGFGFKAGKEGQLYKVEIPEDDTYLLWDRPLSEQSDAVREAIKGVEYFIETSAGGEVVPAFNGNELYRNLSYAMGARSEDDARADREASKFLHSLGINGIKYLDGTSRNQNHVQKEAAVRVAEKRIAKLKKDGKTDLVAEWEKKLEAAKKELDALNYNYVIFDDNAVQILETFYQKGGKDKGGNKLDQFLSDDGLHPDVVADLFGFSSGDELIKKLARAPDPVSEIERLTDQFMVERHADLASPEAMQEAALDAVHNKARARMVATELAILQKAMGSQRMLVKQAKAYADRIVGKTTVRDLKPARYEASEAKAAKEAVKLQAQGKTKEAAIQLRNRVLHNATASAVRDANTEVDKARKFFAKIALASNEKNVKRGRDADVVNAINAVLAQYGFSTKKEKTALEYLSIVEQYDPEMAGFLKPIVDNAMMNAKNWQSMGFDEFMGMRAEIDSLWYMAKRSRQMEVDGKRLDLDEASAMLMERMQQIGIPQDMPGKTSAITPKESAMRSLQYAGALLRRVEQWAEAKDGKFGGAFLRLIFQPVKIAADSYRRDRTIYRKKFKDLVQSLPDMKRGIINAPELNYEFGKGDQKVGMAELLHAVLHTGNESNKRKLLLGRQWASLREDGTLDTGRWDAFMARAVREGLLTKAHFDFAQGVWDLLEETKPLAQKTHREVFGRYFDEVSADQFGIQFPNGETVTYRGGYVPAQVDSRLVNDAAIRELVDSENQNMAYSFPATSKGFTKARVEYNRPLLLNISSLTQHIDKVLLFSHMEPAVRDVNRLLKRADVSEPLSRIDPAAYSGMLLPWLNRAARQSVETPITGDGGMARLLSGIRNRSGMGLMFGNISNTLQQITGVSNALTKVKGSHLRRAVATYIASPREMAERVSASSDFMRNRMDNEIAAITEQMNLILLDPTLFEKSKEWTQKHAYFLQSAFDNVMSPIVWTGAYNQAVTEGMTEMDAGRFADGVVRQTQGTTLPEDVSRIETGPAYARVFTQFTNYFNMLANTNVTELQKTAQDVGLKKGAGRALGIFFYGVLAPAWIAEAIALSMRGGPEDDDDDGYLDDWLSQVIGMGTLKMLLAGVPFVGQFANAGIARFNGNPLDDRVSLSPAVSLLESGFGAPYSVYKAIVDDGDKRKAVRDVATLLTLATGLPFIAAARPVGYLAAVADDKVEPTNVLDFARGTVTGVASPQSK